jgi:predicted RNA binding protein YcfA (HicA-like mRNA interferase family)
VPKLPGVPHRRAVKVFEKAGFWVVREGKHISMTDGERIIIIPRANPINAFTMGGPVVEGVVTVPRLRILGQEQAALDVVFTCRPFPYRVDGVMGLNFLLPYRLCVDFPNSWIELVSP